MSALRATVEAAGSEDAATSARPVSALPEILVRTSQDITAVLDTLYRSRALLERATVPPLHHTHEKRVRISDATESAANDLLDGLGRSLVLIDALSGELARMGVGHTPAVSEIQQQLRQEVHTLIACMQFQDIIAQQIAYATRILRETEQRMRLVAEHFDNALFGRPQAAEPHPLFQPLDPGPTPTTVHDPALQDLADSIFGSARARV